MTEPMTESMPPRGEYEPHGPTEADIARKNMVWGWALFGLFCLLFAGTIGVAYIYLWLS